MNFELMKNFMDNLTENIVPGNSIVIYKDSKKVFTYQSGYSDFENKIKMKGDELFNIYSCSKVTTVTAAMQLFEKGKFLLDDPISEYIPEFKEMFVKKADGEIVKAKTQITFRHLFTMTAGLSYDMNTPAFEKARKLTNEKMDTVTVAKCITEDPLLFEPGEHWNYSLCHDVLASLVEVISGKKFREYVKETIFEPLEMNNSFYHHTDEIRSRMAQQYLYQTDSTTDDIVEMQKNRVCSEGWFKNVGKDVSHILGEEYDSGGAGIITCVEDYGKLTAALANGGLGLNGERILSRAAIELLRINQLNEQQIKTFTWPQLAGYGYGLGVRTMIDKARGGSMGSIGEFGWGGAAGATVLVDPDLKLSMFYTHHMLNPREEYYQPRLRNVLYACMD